MIQRIQSIFLLLITILSIALFLLPVFILKTAAQQTQYYISSNMLTSIVVALTGLIAFICMFLYKNRPRQMMLCRLNLLFIIGSVGLILQASDPSSFTGHPVIKYGFAVSLPLIQIILDWLAIRYIKKDEDLIRSADRLR